MAAEALAALKAEDDTAAITHTTYRSEEELRHLLKERERQELTVDVADAIEMVAELMHLQRTDLLRLAVVAWFYHAIGFPVLEAECHEQTQTDDMPWRLLVFRVRLDADHATEEKAAKDGGQKLTEKYRDLLSEVLLEDLWAKQGGVAPTTSTENLIKISWTTPGTLELGGVAAMGPISLIVMSLGLGLCPSPSHSRGYWEDCCCPCVARPGRAERRALSVSLQELRAAGTSVEVAMDGSATLRVPPRGSGASMRDCPGCAVL